MDQPSALELVRYETKENVMIKANQNQKGIGLGIVLLLILLISLGAVAALKYSTHFTENSTHSILKGQLRLRALSLIDQARLQLQRKIQTAFVCQTDRPNCTDLTNFPMPIESWVTNPVIPHPQQGDIQDQLRSETQFVTIECRPLSGSMGTCTWDRSSFPKQFRVTAQAHDKVKSVIVRYIATIEIAPASLRNMAYLVTSETDSSVNFGAGEFFGKVGILFAGENLGSKRINFKSGDIRFRDSFFTNLPMGQITYPSGPSAPEFDKGITTGTSNFADLLRNTFQTMSTNANVIRPDRSSLPPNTVFEQTVMTIGNSSDPCHIKLEHRAYEFDQPACEAFYSTGASYYCQLPIYRNRFLRSPLTTPYFQGALGDGKVVYAPSSAQDLFIRTLNGQPYSGPDLDGGLVVESGLSTPNQAQICASNYSVIASNDIKLRSSLIRDSNITNDRGNVAFISLNGTKGIIIDSQSKYLGSADASSTFESLGTTNLPPNQTSFKVEASLVALAPNSSALYFDPELISPNGTNRHLGTFETHGGVIGAKYRPSKILDSTGAVQSGFDRTNLMFNMGALKSPPPGFAESQTSLIGSAITSLSLDADSAAEAIASLRE